MSASCHGPPNGAGHTRCRAVTVAPSATPAILDGKSGATTLISALSNFVSGLLGGGRRRGPGGRAHVIKAPDPLLITPDDPRPRVFLAGSIGQGGARDWQNRVIRELSDLDIVIVDPRRADWDASWRIASDDPQFRRQVEWELQAMEYAELIVMGFEPTAQSPITLMEFGLYARTGRLIVFCPEGFWRKGNVDITAEYFGVKQVESFDELISTARKTLGA